MKTILLITDHSPEAENAAMSALMIAQAVGANIVVADTVKNKQVTTKGFVTAGGLTEPGEDLPMDMVTQLREKVSAAGGYIPEITQIDISGLTINDLIIFINHKKIWLLVEGMTNKPGCLLPDLKLNVQSVLDRVGCPLLLIPQSWQVKNFERLVYLADLRYCRQFVLKFIGMLAAGFDACISIAHLSAKGLVDIVDNYATEIFQTSVIPHTHHGKISLNNILERDLHKAADVLINGMHNDLMVLVNHRYHFEELIGRRIGEALPADITIPVLIFPL
jgi:hypothetical protein